MITLNKKKFMHSDLYFTRANKSSLTEKTNFESSKNYKLRFPNLW